MIENGKSENSKDKIVCEIVARELQKFSELVKGHEKLLKAIGEL
ncbi:MAG TPA: hypothetical protein VJK72_00220 [Candidatus Nanoarchaeia archaeon]|nr:hypothetical protein [Candidatus Nanoarchaeia archaeon]